MMRNRKAIGILLILLGLIIIGLIVFYLYNTRETRMTELPVIPGQPGEEISDEPSSNPGNVIADYRSYDLSQVSPKAVTADDLGKLAMSVTERFGSFSSQSNYSNLTDLKIIMTESLGTWVDTYVGSLRKEHGSESYYGIVTKAINYQVLEFDAQAGRAEIVVSTQRQESTGEMFGGDPYSQDLRLVFLEVNGDWLFDAAYWSKD
jgi:hypothetical protein